VLAPSNRLRMPYKTGGCGGAGGRGAPFWQGQNIGLLKDAPGRMCGAFEASRGLEVRHGACGGWPLHPSAWIQALKLRLPAIVAVDVVAGVVGAHVQGGRVRAGQVQRRRQRHARSPTGWEMMVACWYVKSGEVAGCRGAANFWGSRPATEASLDPTTRIDLS